MLHPFLTRRYSVLGAAVAICDIIPVAVLEEAVGEQIRDEGAQVLCFRADVSKEDEVEQLVQQTIRSEEHTSELQSQAYLVCRLLLEKKNTPFSLRYFPFSPSYRHTTPPTPPPPFLPRLSTRLLSPPPPTSYPLLCLPIQLLRRMPSSSFIPT